MSVTSKLRRPALLLAAAAALAPALAACSHSDTTGSLAPAYPVDFRDRHPIVLAHTPRVLDVFVQGTRGLDDRERADVAAFAAEYRRYGNGPLIAQVPVGVPYAGATRSTLERVRGAAGVRLAVSSYRPTDPEIASPIRLSFKRMQAKVAGECGLWPQDLGVADYEFNMKNQPYWNLGCATRSAMADQIADPVDLVRGRRPTAPDTGRRMFNIEKLRQGTDPTTQYKQEGATVKQGISQ